MDNNNKNIVIYGHVEDKTLEIFKDNYNLNIVIFLSNKETKKYVENEHLCEVFIDDEAEDLYVKDCFFVLYNCDKKRSDRIIQLIEKYNKPIFIVNDNYLDEIKYFIESGNINENNIKKFNDYYFEKNREKNMERNVENNAENNTENDMKNENNIDIKIDKIENTNKTPIENINIITVFKEVNDQKMNFIQVKIIIENIDNQFVDKICVVGYNITEFFKTIKVHSNKLILLDINEEISFKELIKIANDIFNGKIVSILRSDIILPFDESLHEINFDLSAENKTIYALSRLDRTFNGQFLRLNRLHQTLYSTEQDAFIFNSPVTVSDELLEKLNGIYFYDRYSNLLFNNIMKENGYSVINNTKKYKVIRLVYDDNNADNRPIMNNNVIDNDVKKDMYLLPSNEIIDEISFEDLIKVFNLNEKELYSIKTELFNRYLKNKIIGSI